MRGFRYLEQFVYDDLDEKAPVWTFHVSEVTVRKHLLMVHGKNTVALWYEAGQSVWEGGVFGTDAAVSFHFQKRRV